MTDRPDKLGPTDEAGATGRNAVDRAGGDDGSDELLGLVYDQLRSLARTMMAREGAGHTLQTTALVHEAYVRLSREDAARWNNRRHFYLVAGQAMRRILVDRARRRARLKHGGDHTRVPLDQVVTATSEEDIDIVGLDDAIRRLSHIDGRAGQLITLRYFAGLSLEDAAGALEIPVTTARRDWNYARAWLSREMGGDDGSDEVT